MKHPHFRIPNNFSNLHDELLDTCPDLRPVPNTSGILEPVMRFEGDDANVWLTVPDDADEGAISAVVQTHDPGLPSLDPAAQRRDRVRELLAIGRSNWTAFQRNELIELLGQRVTG